MNPIWPKTLSGVLESNKPTFIDIFAGCGGLSLGLLRAGWNGLFAIERDAYAFETLSANLVDSKAETRFQWPNWLPRRPTSVESVLENFGSELQDLRGSVDLLAGGPPCQGFSAAGKRNPNDPRNILMERYFQFVDEVKPRVLLIENVSGIAQDFNDKKTGQKIINFLEILTENLSREYEIYHDLVNVSDFGVPQARKRFLLVGLRRTETMTKLNPFDILERRRKDFLQRRRLKEATPAVDAISDLEVARNGKAPSKEFRRFDEIQYLEPLTEFQKLMRTNFEAAPTDTRLANHRVHIVSRFEEIIASCKSSGRLGLSVRKDLRDRYHLKKQALRVLDPSSPSPTITSMPDDLLHYSEPRTLTVRENARLQSFPDWFEFKGKYTSGGDRRKREVPRFTQVANAVPPLLAEALGEMLLELLSNDLSESDRSALSKKLAVG